MGQRRKTVEQRFEQVLRVVWLWNTHGLCPNRVTIATGMGMRENSQRLRDYIETMVNHGYIRKAPMVKGSPSPTFVYAVNFDWMKANDAQAYTLLMKLHPIGRIVRREIERQMS